MTQIKEAVDSLRPFLDQANMYRFNPLSHPHKLTPKEIQELEMLHYHLTEFIYRIHAGDWEAKLIKRETSFEEYSKEMKRVHEQRKPPYSFI